MSQISRYPIRKDVENRIFEVFVEVVAGLKEPSDINNFLEDFLTPVEKIMLAKRLSIAVLLSKGYQYREIQEILRVTPRTISSVNTLLVYRGKGYKNVVGKILHEEKMNSFWSKVDSILGKIIEPVPPKGANWSDWRKEKVKKENRNTKPF